MNSKNGGIVEANMESTFLSFILCVMLEKLNVQVRLIVYETFYENSGMWGTDSGGHLHGKNHLVLYK